MTAKIINFGSINVDHIYQVPHFVAPGETLASTSLRTVLGGKGANQSVAVARAGVAVAHVGQISAQDAWALDELKRAGVDTQAIKLMDGASGHAIIQVTPAGENAIVLHGGANRNCRLSALKKALSAHANAEYLLLQNECNLVPEALDLASTRGLKIALNPAPMTESIKALPLDRLDLLVVNEVEGRALSGASDTKDILARLESLASTTDIVLSLGSEGAVLSKHGQRYHQQARDVATVDTTGAGDTFVGYFLAGIVDNLDPHTNLARACDAAALAVTMEGAIPSIPNLSDVTACTE